MKSPVTPPVSPRKRPTKYANHPIVKYVRSLDQEFYLGREVAQQLGCSIGMLAYVRRRAGTLMGPTHQGQYGAAVVHLYTPERIAEIAAYLRQIKGGGKGHARRGPAVLWTRTESARRRREFDRARSYRNRAAGYREQAMPERAAELEQVAAELITALQKAAVARRLKVYGRKRK